MIVDTLDYRFTLARCGSIGLSTIIGFLNKIVNVTPVLPHGVATDTSCTTMKFRPLLPERNRVSVIIPTFNRALLCARAVRSALAQTYTALEIIVVDDGSTDDTRAHLTQEFGSTITVLAQPNAGVSAARNRGLAASTGEFIAFLDSDDEWLPDKTERQVKWLRARPDFGMVLCDLISVHLDGRELGRSQRRTVIKHDGDILEELLIQPSLVPSTAMLRRDVYERFGGFDTDLPTAEDLDFHLRVATQTRIGLLEEHLVRINRGDDAGLSMLLRTHDDRVAVVARFAETHGHQLRTGLLKAAMFSVFYSNSRSTALGGQTLEALRFAWRSLRHVGTGSDIGKLLYLVPLLAKSAVKRMISILLRRQPH